MGTRDTSARRLVGRVLLVTSVAVAIGSVSVSRASAQGPREERRGPSLLLIDADTRVKDVGFRFTGGSTLDKSAIREAVGLRSLNFVDRWKRRLAWLPFVDAPPLMPFEPLDVQRDKVRLTRFYERHGFPNAEVSYAVRLDTASNTVAVTFEISEEDPLRLNAVRLADSSGAAVEIANELASDWQRLQGELAAHQGHRLSEQLATRLRGDVLGFLKRRGYAFARVTGSVQEADAELLLTVQTGPRATIGDVVVEGNERLEDATVRRGLPFAHGDRFNSDELAEGQRRLFGLDIVRLALVDIRPEQPQDSTANVLVQVNEGALRTIEGRVGYATEGGVSGDANWRHRDFLGGARTLSTDVTARTGLWSTEAGAQVRLGASVTLRQPFFIDYRLTGLLSPSIEYRDDQFDRSTRWGAGATALWERGPLRTASLRYGYSIRNVYEARGGGLAGVTDLIGLLRALDTTDVDVRSSVLTGRVSWGRMDNLLDPTDGWLARLSTEVAGPAPISSVEYGRLEASLRRFVPLGDHSVISLRASTGRLLPFGRSLPRSSDDGLPSLLRLRDVIFTAGGTDDVRGWAADLLGPKVADVRVSTEGDSLVLRSAGRYVPLGGLARWTSSAELRVPMPWLGTPHAVFGFVDAGQVWIPDARFLPEGADRGLDDGVRAGTGLGLQFASPVGPIRIAVGYKLNPSSLDLRDPGAVANALLLGESIESVPADPFRRWQFHLSLGRSY